MSALYCPLGKLKGLGIHRSVWRKEYLKCYQTVNKLMWKSGKIALLFITWDTNFQLPKENVQESNLATGKYESKFF